MISAPMAQRLEVLHVGFLLHVKKSKAKRLREGSWQKAAAKNPSGSRDTAAPDLLGHDTGNSFIVGGPTAYFWSLCEGDRILGRE